MRWIQVRGYPLSMPMEYPDGMAVPKGMVDVSDGARTRAMERLHDFRQLLGRREAHARQGYMIAAMWLLGGLGMFTVSAGDIIVAGLAGTITLGSFCLGFASWDLLHDGVCDALRRQIREGEMS